MPTALFTRFHWQKTTLYNFTYFLIPKPNLPTYFFYKTPVASLRLKRT